MPNSEASEWNCKYAIKASTTNQTKTYTYLEVEQYGFENSVYVIVQPSTGPWIDYDPSATTY